MKEVFSYYFEIFAMTIIFDFLQLSTLRLVTQAHKSKQHGSCSQLLIGEELKNYAEFLPSGELGRNRKIEAADS